MMLTMIAVMIGIGLIVMGVGESTAGKHNSKKGWCMDKQPIVKVGDSVRIIKETWYGLTGKKGEVDTVKEGGFYFKEDGQQRQKWISKLQGDQWELLQPTKEQTMTQHAFKPGDRVRIKSSAVGYSSHRIGQIGIIVEEKMGQSYDNCVQFCDGAWSSYKSEHLELFSKALDNLTEGDVVVDKDDTDDTIAVTHVLKPGLYVMSDYDEEPWLYTAKELENLEYIPQQDPKNDKTRLTVAEVARKLGLNPDTLHIVADKKAV